MARQPTESPYLDPAGYDSDTAARVADISFYRSLVSPRASVLDLCCGTGRLTLPLKTAASSVVGLDHCEAMLTLARRKDPSLEWVRADASSFELGRRFDLIVCGFNSFQHFLEDADRSALLASVRRHLEPGGAFAFDVWNELPASLFPFESGPKQSLKGLLKRAVAPLKPMRHFVVSREGKFARMEWHRFGAEARSRTVLYRCYGAQELKSVLKEAGFSAQIWGGFGREPLARSSESLAVVARPI